MKCLECDCHLVRDYKCPHDCDMCRDCDPEDIHLTTRKREG